MINRHPSITSYASLDQLQRKFTQLAELEEVEEEEEPIIIAGTNLSWIHELHSFWVLAWPVILTCLLELSPGIVSVMLVGRFCSKQELDATALGTMFSNILGLSLGFGMATAMDTLCSQAYGAGRHLLMGVYLQRGILILALMYIPIFIFNWFCGDILILLGQPHEVSILSGQFVRWLLPGIPAIWLYDLSRKVVQSMGVVAPMMWIAVVSNILNIFLTYYILAHTNVGFLGAAIARTVANISMPVLLLAYIGPTKFYKNFWPGWSQESLTGWKEFTSLGFPGMLAMCLEWWAFEALAVLSGLVPHPEEAIGANAIMLNASTMAYMFYLGLSVATTVRVGTFMGAGDGDKAWLSAKVGFGVTLLISIINATLFMVFKEQIPYLFVKDKEVASLVTDSIVVLATYQIVDGINIVGTGIFKGIGRQRYSAYINFVSYYILGLPISVFLTFGLDLRMNKVETLWWGMNIGLTTACFQTTYMIFSWDWQETAQEIAQLYLGGYKPLHSV